jgi:hypothetical protein
MFCTQHGREKEEKRNEIIRTQAYFKLYLFCVGGRTSGLMSLCTIPGESKEFACGQQKENKSTNKVEGG